MHFDLHPELFATTDAERDGNISGPGASLPIRPPRRWGTSALKGALGLGRSVDNPGDYMTGVNGIIFDRTSLTMASDMAGIDAQGASLGPRRIAANSTAPAMGSIGAQWASGLRRSVDNSNDRASTSTDMLEPTRKPTQRCTTNRPAGQFSYQCGRTVASAQRGNYDAGRCHRLRRQRMRIVQAITSPFLRRISLPDRSGTGQLPPSMITTPLFEGIAQTWLRLYEQKQARDDEPSFLAPGAHSKHSQGDIFDRLGHVWGSWAGL